MKYIPVWLKFELRAPILLVFLFLFACDNANPEPADGGPTDADVFDGDTSADADPIDGDADSDVDETDADIHYPDREPGAREPLSASCDDADPFLCLLPWPSNTFTVNDDQTETGLRVAIDDAELFVIDDASSLNVADGFSPVSPLMFGFTTEIDDADLSAVHLILSQHDHPDTGREEPLNHQVIADDRSTDSLVIAHPARPLEPNADYVAYVTKELRTVDGTPLTPSRATLLALDLVEPASNDERQLVAYHAPTRATLTAAGVQASEVLLVWEFTTRSAEDSTRWLDRMRAAAEESVDRGEVSVELESVVTDDGRLIVEGRLTDLPSFLTDEGLLLDDEHLPIVVDQGEAPFRIVIPAGSGDYPIVMYGHGTGGTYHDDAFDTEITDYGYAKIGIQYRGWTETDVFDTWLRWNHMVQATFYSTALLLQSLADAAAIQRALEGVLGDALSAETLAGEPNPALGRRPECSEPIWAGGSLGGTMGFVYSASQPSIRFGILNVPGAAWTHFIPPSLNYEMLAGLFEAFYGGRINMIHAVAVTQLNWDPVDGAAWAHRWRDRGGVFLIQESMGDPVLPNIGTHMVATSTDALQVGAVLQPLPGLEEADSATNRTAITQYRVPSDVTSDLAIHGFGARGTPAGEAAREQIRAFIESIAAGEASISIPSGCPEGNCDFSGE